MKRYRLRLDNGRVVGPFTKEQLDELLSKNKISGNEQLQEFPGGDWLKWNESPANDEQNKKEGTFLFNLDDLKKEEIKNDHHSLTSFPLHEIQKINAEKDQQTNPAQKNEIISPSLLEPVDEFPQEFTYDKTQVQEVKSEDRFDRTQVTPATAKYLEELKKQKAIEDIIKKKEVEELRQKELSARPAYDLNNDSTQVISSKHIAPQIIKEAEKELQELEEKVIRDKKQKEKEKEKLAEKLKNEPDALSDTKKKKTRLMIIGVVILALVLLFPAEKEKPKVVPSFILLVPEILYPVPFEEENVQKSELEYKEGLKLLTEPTLKNKIEASKKFRLAYEYSLKNTEALHKLIKNYGDLVHHSGEKEKDGNELFKLIQANQMKLTTNTDVVYGAGQFYLAIGKRKAAHMTVERFIKAKAAPPSLDLFSLYLDILVRERLDEKAKEIFDILDQQKNKSEFVCASIIKYLRSIGDQDRIDSAIDEFIKTYPNSVPLLSLRGEIEFERQNLNKLIETAKRIKELGADGSRIYQAKYLEFGGLILAYQKKNDEAAKLFKDAFDLYPSETLVEALSSIPNIDESATDEATVIIKKAKALRLSDEALKNYERGEFDVGLLTALKAVRLKSGNIKADIVLSKLQLKLGMAQEALQNLSTMAKDNLDNQDIQFAYLDLLIETYKFNEAKKVITFLVQKEEIRDSARYAAANASLYLAQLDYQQGAIWLQKAINLNPLNEKSIFQLAQTLTKLKKFKQAKNYLSRAMELDPENIDFKLNYASLLYETDSADAAISYLFGLLNEYVGNPKILGEIAIYYHRAGKVQQFFDTKKKIEDSPVKDSSIYRFLVKTSLLDQDYEKAQQYGEDLIRVEPGDLVTMMDLGKAFMNQKKFKEAAYWFKKVKDQLPSYPKIGYYKAMIEMYLGNSEQALIDVDNDMKANGEYEEGLVLKGDIFINQENYIEAEKIYKAAQRINPRSADAVLGLANISFKKGQFEISLDLYKRVEKQQPGNPVVHRQLGEVYRFLGQGNLAIESYKMYLELLPTAQDKDQIEQNIRILE